jgi:CheY-like chemotaxis protein
VACERIAADNGTGFEPMNLGRIFDLFPRRHRRSDRGPAFRRTGGTIHRQATGAPPRKSHVSHDKPVILIAEDDPEDRFLIGRAFETARPGTDLRFVSDGEELLDYLHRRGAYADPAADPRPAVVLVDLNLPRNGGRKCLGQIAADPDLRPLRVVVLGTSGTADDVSAAYTAGAASYVTRPATFAGLVEVAATVGTYWLDVVRLPPDRGRESRAGAG